MATKPKKQKQTITSQQIFRNGPFPIKKKNRSGQIRTQNLWRPERIRYLQTNCVEDA